MTQDLRPLVHRHDIENSAIPITPAIADAVECLRVQRDALQGIIDRESREVRYHRNAAVDFQRQTVANVEKRLADAILDELDGKVPHRG